MHLGIEGSGTVAVVGPAVTSFKPGDAVYGFNMDKPMPARPQAGFASEYALAEERFLLHKPPQLSFEDAASLPGLVVTAMQTIRRGLQLAGETSLEGKTVFVPGALSASGSLALQVARNVFGASKVVSTVSTGKMALVPERLPPGAVDKLVDYTREDVGRALGAGSVDFALSTQWTTFSDCLSVLRRNGTLVSIAGIPTVPTARSLLGEDRIPFWMAWLLSVAQAWYWWKLRGTGIRYEFVSGSPNIREDLEAAGEVVARGLVRAVTTVVDLDDVEGVREGCGRVYGGNGGLGKLVIRISGE